MKLSGELGVEPGGDANAGAEAIVIDTFAVTNNWFGRTEDVQVEVLGRLITEVYLVEMDSLIVKSFVGIATVEPYNAYRKRFRFIQLYFIDDY